MPPGGEDEKCVLNQRQIRIDGVNHMHSSANSDSPARASLADMAAADVESAIQSGCADFILSPEDIGRKIRRMGRGED